MTGAHLAYISTFLLHNIILSVVLGELNVIEKQYRGEVIRCKEVVFNHYMTSYRLVTC